MEFQELVDKDKYQVFLFSSRCPFPLTFASHLWFVVNKKGVLSRWEVVHYKKPKGEKVWGHLVLNFLPPFSGLGVLFFETKFRYKGKLLGQIESDGRALLMIDLIENSKDIYPHTDSYYFIGPNSNTYIKWVLSNFPDFIVKIPWNAFG